MQRRDFVRATAATGVALSAMGSALVKADLTREQYRAKPIELPDDIAGDLKFSQAEYDRRYAGIRSAMEEQGIDALLITGNREWARGELGNLLYIGIEKPDWEIMYAVLPKDGPAIVPSKVGGLTPGFRNRNGVVEFEYVDTQLRPGTINSAWHPPAIISALRKAGAANGTIGIVGTHSLPTEAYMALKNELPSATFVDAQMLMLEMRWYKSEEEIRFLRRSAYIADKGNEAMINAAGVGVHDLDIWYAIDKACAEAGAPTGGFHVYGSGPWRGKRSNLFTNPGSERYLEAGDVLAPEIGSEYKGYYTQLTMPVALGTPTDQFYQDLEVCRTVYDHMMTQFRPGKTTRGLDKYGAEFTEDLTDGEVTLVFAFQCGEIERAFYLDDYELKVGATGYNQPLFVRTDGGPIWHVFGDAIVCTDDTPLRLHQTPMDAVILS